MNRSLSIVLLLIPVLTVPALAEVVDSSAHGFTSRSTAKIPASPHEVYARLIHTVNLWWSPDHTYSGNATNLRIDARQGGCFCEDLPNGGVVEHLAVARNDVLLQHPHRLAPPLPRWRNGNVGRLDTRQEQGARQRVVKGAADTASSTRLAFLAESAARVRRQSRGSRTRRRSRPVEPAPR